MIPYTYLIGWSKYNRWYYGCRFSKNCNPIDLWNPYKTSSKHVLNFIRKNGEPDIIQVRKTFSNEKDCRNWEHKVLQRLKVTENIIWLNETDNQSINPQLCSIGAKKAGQKNKGKKLTEEHKRKISSALEGEKNPCYGKYGKNHPSFGHKAPWLVKINKNRVTRLPTNGNKCIIDGKIFQSIAEATRFYNISYNTVYYRIKTTSNKWKNWNAYIYNS